MAVQQLLVSKTTTMPWLETQSRLRLDRQDIIFYNVAERRVRIQVTIHNDGDAASTPTFAHIQSADFGAFLPWRPLARLPVPAIAAGDSVTLQIEVEIAPSTAGALRPPVAKSKTDRNLEDEPRKPKPPLVRRVLNSFLRVNPEVARQQPAARRALELQPDIYELEGRLCPNWVGNLNVFIGHRSVERHMARALRIYPGRLNFAFFIVGTGADAYAFEMPCTPPGWRVSLSLGSGGMFSGQTQIASGTWMETKTSLKVMALMEPPEWSTQGGFEISVRERSTGREAVVEFDFDAEATGPGCYTVEPA